MPTRSRPRGLRPPATRGSRRHPRGASRGQGQLAGHCLEHGGHFRRGPPAHAGGSAGWPGSSIRKLAYPVGSAWNIDVHRGLDVGRLLDVRRDAHPLLDGGIADGRVDLQASTDALRFHVGMGARGVRLGALADNAADEPQLGDPTDVTIRFDGAWRRIGGTIEIPKVRATVAGAALSGSITLRDLDTDPVVDLALGMQHLDFAQLLGASGLAVPESLGMAPGASR